MLKEVFLMALMLGSSFGATLEPCPEGSTCHSTPETLKTTSFEFLSKLSQKDFRSIGSLTISNSSVNKIDPKLKYLKNLAYLDLSYNSVQISSIPSLNSLKTLILKANDLKDISISQLPQNIENLDLSDNLLSAIPRDWRLLKNLKTLDLYKNPIDCDCNNVLNYELLNKRVIIPRPLTCHSPPEYAGKKVSSVNCSPIDMMQYDAPVEGSGETDIFDDSFAEKTSDIKVINEEEDDDEKTNTIVDDRDENVAETTTIDPLNAGVHDEGSGEEGSGEFGRIPESGVLGCIENCETPKPLTQDPTASPLPGFFDQFKMIIDDVNIFKEPTTEAPSTTSTTTESVATPAVVKEPKILKDNVGSVGTGNDRKSEVEQVDNANGTATGELERASMSPKNSTAVYAVVGVGLVIAVLFILAFIKKRRSKRLKEKRREIPLTGEELKPLSKYPITAVNDKPVKNTSNLPEQIPLINGQNGKPRDDTPKLTSFVPLAHPELPNDDDDNSVELNLPNGSPADSDEVEIRPKIQSELLTPQRERVTIREAELPESVPRTPLLVHRQKNSEGEIVTTLVS
ncbi:protein windpipe [Diabrotica virgifera virgifera]|uniref:Protein windpipe n=1 Tax=Diabrotica virgifera virgifera TaxID=50390 RepID=A0A6P7GX05_DIAVI|nr:protein windpipe [Diabrotica virgifera virgifera]